MIIPQVAAKVAFFAAKDIGDAFNIKKFTQKDILLLLPPTEIVPLNVDTERFIYSIGKLGELDYLENIPKARIHIKINSGMNRFGINSRNELEKILELSQKMKMSVEGIYTHLYSTDKNACLSQIELFEKIVNKSVPIKKHITFKAPLEKSAYAPFDFVRSGIDVLGCNGSFNQCLKISAKIIAIRKIAKGETVGYDKKYVAKTDTKVAILRFGYNDMAIKKIKAQKVLINKNFYPIISVAMDISFVEVDEKVNEKDEAIITADIFGVRICDIAKDIKTAPHELLTSIKSQ